MTKQRNDDENDDKVLRRLFLGTAGSACLLILKAMTDNVKIKIDLTRPICGYHGLLCQ